MIKNLLKFLKTKNLISPEDKILLAVSGGVDSMVMSHVFLQAGIDFAIAHVNYGLRGIDSIEDQTFVEEWGKKNDIHVHSKVVKKEEFDSTESIQMMARKIRYDFFDLLLVSHGFNKIATAHHLDDSFETVLLNLIRGTGSDGMKGISIKNGRIIRPMLFASRQEIVLYAQENEIKWREDSSNSKNDYKRNLIRNKVIPILKEINPSLTATYKDTYLRLHAASALMSKKKNEVISEFITIENGIIDFGTDWVKDDSISITIFSDILSDYGMSFRHAKDVFRSILSKRVGNIFTVENYQINIDRGKILIGKTTEKNGEVLIEINKDDKLISLGDKSLYLEIENEQLKITPDNKVAYLDYRNIDWPLTLRRWKQGDKFVPLGMRGKKMVSDFMIDNKIPLTLKQDTLVLVSAGEIVWVVGHRISDLFKLKKETKRTLKISISDD